VRVRESAEQALRASERLYRAIGESMQYGVWVCDAEGRNTYCSDSYLRLLGLTPEQYAGFGCFDALDAAEGRPALAQWQECVRTGTPWYREMRVRSPDGASHWILSQGVPIRDEGGAITGWAGIHLDIGRLKRTEEALREADRRKDEFLATLAHELRNPLAPIRHAVRILDASGAGERQRLWSREVIARQVQRMALLLDDLLDVSRITRGRLELKKDYVTLSTLVASAVETARPLIETKRHVLEVSLPAEPIELEADPLRLSQALSNLLTNAAKYTDPGGRIVLSAVLEPEQLTIAVQDSGIGLAPAALPRLFEMFSQIDSAIDRAEGGLGIGLALVRGLVGLHGGDVQATSEGLGRGSRFTIRLPRSLVVSARARVAEPLAQARALRPPGCRVLIADDNRDAAETLAAVLRLSDHEVHVAHGGHEALELAAQVRPHALILDIGMPGMTGYEVARRARAQAWGRRALLLAVTGWGQRDDKERARAAGFDQHLTKPVDPYEIEQLLAGHAQQVADAQHGADAPLDERRPDPPRAL